MNSMDGKHLYWPRRRHLFRRGSRRHGGPVQILVGVGLIATITLLLLANAAS
jgi:hypothetical protein